jgi:tetratricopeptide (TPR) repeat protein
MRCLGWIALVGVVCAGTAGRADEASDLQAARQHTQRGMALFDLQRYDDAIKEYEAAFELRNDPVLLFDMAQAYRKANRPAQAIHFYRAYLARDPNAENRQRVEERIRELERQVPPAQAPPTPPATTPTPPTPSTRPPQASAPEPVPARPEASRVTPTPRPPLRARLVAGIAVGAAGVGLVAGGIALAVLSGHAADTLNAADRNHTAYDPALYNTNQHDAIGGGLLLGFGAAALATGGALIAIDIKAQRGARGSLAFAF